MARRRLLIGFALFLLTAACAGFFGLTRRVGATNADTPGQFDPYLHRTDGALADPINLIFQGSVDQAAAAVQAVLGWQPVDGSEMVFYDHGAHLDTAKQFGLDLGGGSRYHLRLEAVQDDGGQTYVLSGVHRDDSVACGHVGRAFNNMRDLVGNAFAAAGYKVTQVQLENTTPGRQCDGSFTFGDGIADIVTLTGPQRAATSAHKDPALRLPFGIVIPLPHLHF
jgi:hypothetical protein